MCTGCYIMSDYCCMREGRGAAVSTRSSKISKACVYTTRERERGGFSNKVSNVHLDVSGVYLVE